jgi:trehalose 6-phosphate synthase
VKRAISFIAALLCSLALLAWLGYSTLVGTTRTWFERDMALRANLAVTSADLSLMSAWRSGDVGALAAILDRITRDERILGAAACSATGRMDVATAKYPAQFSCARLVERAGSRASSSSQLSFSADQEAGPVRISIHPIGGIAPLGSVVLIQDLSFAVRRDQTTRKQVLLGFFVLALCASAVTALAGRLYWRHWLAELHRALSGRASRDFRPLVQHVRELVERLTQERDSQTQLGRWTPERLRGALTEHLRGERIVLLANREPYIHERDPSGAVRVVHPASGLVTALEPVMRACSGVWVAHGAGSADRETVDAYDRVPVPPDERSYWLRRVWLSSEQETGFYYGFSNEGLWPLCHIAHARPTFRAADFEHYRQVNQKFANAVCEEVDIDDPIILVQDYHFALAPRMIRQRLPKATILTFWHIPWPNAERFGICPWRREIVEGLLGSSIVGFHTNQHCNNFLEAVDSFVESRIDREHRSVAQSARSTLVRPYPISIEWPVRWLDDLPPSSQCRGNVLFELGLPATALLGVGVDRLDYTKGIEERLQAVDELLTRYPEFRDRFVFVQLAAPSRERIERYRDLNQSVEKLASEINRKWSSGGRYRPVILHRSHHEPSTVFKYYRAADLCYVSSLHDGMNLVAKEFVAARDDERGVLVLSQFTGAARELTEALIVNPYDLQEASDAMAHALRMSESEQAERMRSMRKLVAELNVYRWAGRMLIDAAELRRRERLNERLERALGSATMHADLHASLRAQAEPWPRSSADCSVDEEQVARS